MTDNVIKVDFQKKKKAPKDWREDIRGLFQDPKRAQQWIDLIERGIV